MIKNFEIGKNYADYATHRDDIKIDFDHNGFSLYILLNGISAKENKQYNQYSSYDIRFTVIDDIAFFLFKFGDMPWMDAPFSPSIYWTQNKLFDIIQPAQDQGYALTLSLFDSSSGKLKQVRLIGLDHDLSNNFFTWSTKAAENKMEYSEYLTRISKIYSKCTTEDIVTLTNA